MTGQDRGRSKWYLPYAIGISGGADDACPAAGTAKAASTTPAEIATAVRGRERRWWTASMVITASCRTPRATITGAPARDLAL